MSRRNPTTEFLDLAGQHFEFLVDEEGFVGPERQADGLGYYSPTLSVEVRLDPREHAVVTLLSGMVHDRCLRAELSCVYAEAALGPVQHVKRAARTAHAMQGSVASQAEALRRLLPVVVGPERDRLLTACHAS